MVRGRRAFFCAVFLTGCRWVILLREEMPEGDAWMLERPKDWNSFKIICQENNVDVHNLELPDDDVLGLRFQVYAQLCKSPYEWCAAFDVSVAFQVRLLDVMVAFFHSVLGVTVLSKTVQCRSAGVCARRICSTTQVPG